MPKWFMKRYNKEAMEGLESFKSEQASENDKLSQFADISLAVNGGGHLAASSALLNSQSPAEIQALLARLIFQPYLQQKANELLCSSFSQLAAPPSPSYSPAYPQLTPSPSEHTPSPSPPPAHTSPVRAATSLLPPPLGVVSSPQSDFRLLLPEQSQPEDLSITRKLSFDDDDQDSLGGQSSLDGGEKKGKEGFYPCPDCGKTYSTSSNLARHRQTHRSLEDKKARKCPHCDKTYVSMPAYSMHLRTHNQGCKCNFCGKSFSRPWLLQGHIRTHTGEKPFTCNLCNKAFADKSNLRAHVQTHSTEKPHVCQRCNKAFALKSYLYKHEESSCMRSFRSKDRRRKNSEQQQPRQEASSAVTGHQILMAALQQRSQLQMQTTQQ